MKFSYKAADAAGKVVEGSIDAENTGDVLASLAAKGLRPISVSAEKTVERKSQSIFGQSINVTDKIFLTRYLALMLRVGTDLFKAINILIANFDKAIVKSLLLEIRTNLEKGQPFYQTFAAYPKYFSPVFVNLVKAGEASGNLQTVFEDLSVNLEKEHELQSKIRSALIYPVILFVLSLFVLLFLVSFALPRIASVFQGGGFDPPLFSKIVFTVGLAIGNNIAIILAVLAVVIFGGWIFIAKTLAGRRFVSALLNVLPVVKTVVYKIALQRFAATLSSLMGAGLPILESLNITADAVVHPGIQDALRRVAKDGVTKGLSLGEAFSREPIFPPVVVNLVAISEKAGHLDQVLKTLADFYDSEISAAVKNLVAFIEPLLLVLIGGVIGLIALSILVPIYQLVTQF
ncbi:MAG: type II secretion system F family protein [bacterium]|nr:type II secretion system F family protein [bacterium]